MPGYSFDLLDVLDAASTSRTDDIFVARPGKVTAYDPLTNTVVVKPMVKREVARDEDDERVYEELPEIPFVPVCFPRCGGMALTFPVSEGDSVLLVFCDVSIAEWRDSGELSDPRDCRRHSIGYPIAIPGVYPQTAGLSVVAGDLSARSAGVVLGEHGGNGRIEVTSSVTKLRGDATEFVALANLVMARLDAIQTAFDTHGHAVPPLSPPSVLIGPLASVAAASTKAK